MEPEVSLPCSQEPSTGPYHKSDQSSPYYLSKIHFNIILGMARPQVADTGDGIQIWRVAANILNKK
jgi:hypothetical protein